MNFWVLAGIVLTLLPLSPVTVAPPPSSVVVVTNAVSTEPSEGFKKVRTKQRARMRGMLGVYVFIAGWVIVFGLFVKGGRGGSRSTHSNPGSYSTGSGRWRGMP